MRSYLALAGLIGVALALLLAGALTQSSLARSTDTASVPGNTFSTGAFGGWLATGTYSGDGSDDRTITGAGFQPDVVFVKSDVGQSAVIRTSTMAGDATKVATLGGSLLADEIQSLDSNGFTIGTSARVNANSQTFYWVAMKAGTNMQVGSYVGDGIDNRSITGVGFQPVWVLTMGDGEESWYKAASLAGDASWRIDGLAQFTNRIQALEADGFQIGSNTNINKASTTFHYIAWKGTASVKQTAYTGNSADDRSITGVGFQPLFVWVKRDTNSQAAWRAAQAGTLSSLWDSTASQPNDIQALEADGFQVGNNARTNTTGTYHYLAFKN